jgi:hypothetical protein
MKMYKDVGGQVIGDRLPSTRSAIRNHVANRFPSTTDVKYDKDLIRLVQQEILTTLRVAKQ